MITLHGRQVINIQIEGVDPYDYPDFSDAYIASANFADTGEPLADWELDTIAQEYPDLIGEEAMEECVGMADRADYLYD